MNTKRTDARRNLSLRHALDRARDALLHRDLPAARRSIIKAGEQGPLAVRPTRLLWDVVFRWLKASKKFEGGPLDEMFVSERSANELDAAKKKKGPSAFKHFKKALGHCPLSPEAIYRTGLYHFEESDHTEAALWLRLVPDILDGERRRGPISRNMVADSYLTLARIELARGHRSRAASLALKALDVKADFPAARSFIWELEHHVGRP